jgi:hypothetical protein
VHGFRQCISYVVLQQRMLVVTSRMSGNKPCDSNNKSFESRVGKSKYMRAGESAKLKISALTGAHPPIVASGTHASG